MGGFDQRGQHVQNQTNIVGNQYNLGSDPQATADVLRALLADLNAAASSGEIDAETAAETGRELEHAANECANEKPDKSKALGYLDAAKTVMAKGAGAAAATTKFAGALEQLYEKVQGWAG